MGWTHGIGSSSTCTNCGKVSYGKWYSDRGNDFCSPGCAERYNQMMDQKREANAAANKQIRQTVFAKKATIWQRLGIGVLLGVIGLIAALSSGGDNTLLTVLFVGGFFLVGFAFPRVVLYFFKRKS